MANFYSKLLAILDSAVLSNLTWVQVVGSSVALITAGIWATHLNLSHRRAKEAPVLWSWIPIFGSALEFGQRPIELMLEQSKKTEDIVGILVAGQRMFVIHDSNSYNVIIKADKKKLSFDEFTVQIQENSFGLSKTESADCRRDPAARALYNKYLFQDEEGTKLTTAMVHRLDKLVSALPKEKKVVQVYDFVSRFAFQGSIAALFNEEMADIDGLYESFLQFDAKFGLSVAGLPLNLFPGALKGREACVDACAKAVKKAKGMIDARVKLYSTETADGAPPAAFDDVVRYQMAMMWASVANTMPGAYWTLYFIMLNPVARGAVMTELSEVFGPLDPNASRVPTTAQLQDLKIVDSCISEALRLMSGSLIMRQVMTDDCELTLSSGNTYRFRKGDKVGIFPTISHYDEKIFKDPNDFKYDRFVERPGNDSARSSKMNTCFLPFGAGATYCPGRKFARNEIKTIVYYLLRFFDIDFVDINEAKKCARAYEPSRAGLGIFPPLNLGIEMTIQPIR